MTQTKGVVVYYREGGGWEIRVGGLKFFFIKRGGLKFFFHIPRGRVAVFSCSKHILLIAIYKIFSGGEHPDPPLLLCLFIIIFYSQWSFYLHAADSLMQPHDVCWHMAERGGGVALFVGHERGSQTFPRVSRGGVEVFSQPPSR